MNRTFDVQRMSRGHCECAMTHEAQAIDLQVKVDFPAARIDVQSDQLRDTLENAIRDKGYNVA